ncbi:hypothetical protein AKJ38_01845 [candidate division MSBL1 archaeon SCGC-AAA259I14]|uniref:ABC transporter substrate-binding protein PnrA-like domain-containing protein n=2 Tax=candidate division MSBL1 TaxID=215777 RepID=A0A133USQ1_9EURY|nr:hypothetical protein AKJ66_01380 [candidate division MSBL1 archaeon SCGC-AAA259E22]KXA97160.1 hypothetical protein AKJ38_01845 [candidate division MSBL1 archaeon SCGC-AAA259I14]
MNNLLDEKGISVAMAVIISVIVTGIVVGVAVYMVSGGEDQVTPEENVTAEDVETFLQEQDDDTVRGVLGAASQDVLGQVLQQPREMTLAIEHFSVVEGTTWDGAHYRGAQRLTDKYPSLEYVYREEVGPDQTNPFAEELISEESADIIVGSAEFMGLPLADIADDYPDKYFVSILASDVTTKRNFIRFFPRQYQALYLEGLIAGALTDTGNIGIVSAFPTIQVLRREGAFHLGVKKAEEILGKDVTIYKQYAGDWFLPTEERNIAESLVTNHNCDVLTQQTDSGSPLDVAEEEGVWFVGKDMDVVGEYGWSDTSTVAVSFDTRWEVGYEKMIADYYTGNPDPDTFLYPGMSDAITLADGSTLPTVDIQNNNKIGVNAISPEAEIPDEIIAEVEEKRDLMMKGVWDPFYAFELVSNGTGMEDAPEKGTVVWEAGEMPAKVNLFRDFNFDLEGIELVD